MHWPKKDAELPHELAFCWALGDRQALTGKVHQGVLVTDMGVVRRWAPGGGQDVSEEASLS